jgi:hypothetical protein
MNKDLIASATLARLYIEQGHLSRARAVVNAVLDRDPLDGHALALRDRLQAHSNAAVDCKVDGGELRISWRRVAGARLATVRIAICDSGQGSATRFVEVQCKRPNGSHRIPRPDSPASAVACILGPDPESSPGTQGPPRAVSNTVSW